LELAAPMHDTGKIGIPDTILRKPGKLDNDEWITMRSHCRIGHDILAKSDAPVFKLAAEIALYHHEKWDGSGYPHGLAGNDVSAAVRIVVIADVFDALTMRRPYKEAWTLEQATHYLQENAGRHFDPELIELFMGIMPRIKMIRKQWGANQTITGEVL
jgi:putative two-component system response regulator